MREYSSNDNNNKTSPFDYEIKQNFFLSQQKLQQKQKQQQQLASSVSDE